MRRWQCSVLQCDESVRCRCRRYCPVQSPSRSCALCAVRSALCGGAIPAVAAAWPPLISCCRVWRCCAASVCVLCCAAAWCACERCSVPCCAVLCGALSLPARPTAVRPATSHFHASAARVCGHVSSPPRSHYARNLRRRSQSVSASAAVQRCEADRLRRNRALRCAWRQRWLAAFTLYTIQLHGAVPRLPCARRCETVVLHARSYCPMRLPRARGGDRRRRKAPHGVAPLQPSRLVLADHGLVSPRYICAAVRHAARVPLSRRHTLCKQSPRVGYVCMACCPAG